MNFSIYIAFASIIPFRRNREFLTGELIAVLYFIQLVVMLVK